MTSPLALRLSAQSFPADSALRSKRCKNPQQNNIIRPKVCFFLLCAFLSFLSGSNAHAFPMPTQAVIPKQTQTTAPVNSQTQSTQIAEKMEEEGVLKFLRSAPDPQKLPLSFDVRAGYVVKVAKMDYGSGEIVLHFHNHDTMMEVGQYRYIHHGIKAQTTPMAEEIQTALASLPTQKDRASEYRKIYRTDRDVDFAQFLVAMLTFDDEVVDFSRSILENRVRLKGSFTPSFSLETFDDKILLFYISMFANVDEMLNQINSWVLFLVLPFAVFFLLNRKITSTISGKQDPADYWGKGVYTMAILYTFYVISGTISVGENQISRTNFQSIYGAAIRKSVEFATAITEVFGETYVNVQRKNSGLLSKDEIEKIAIEQLEIQKKIKAYAGILGTCEKAVVGDIFFREEGGKYRIQEGMSTISPLRPEYRRALLSLELCDFSETAQKSLTAQKEENDRILGNFAEAANDRRVQAQLSSLADSQIRNIESFGFFSLPLIAAGNMFSENIGLYDRNVKSQSQIEKTREEIRKNEGMEKGVVADSVIAGVIETLPYLMLPAAGTVSSTISATVGSATSTLEKIPFFGNLLTGAKQAVAHGATIFLYGYLVKYLPLITLVIASFLVMVYWLLSVVVYLFISPYMVVWMLANSEEDAIRKFLVKGLVIWSRPLTLSISVVLCIVFLDLFRAITDLLIDEQFANFFNITMSQGIATVTYNFADFGLFFVKGFFSVALAIIGVVLSFYIVFNGAEILLKMLGVNEESGDAQGIIGREIDSRGGQYSRPMAN